MKRNLVCIASVVVAMATLALMPARAQRQDLSLLAQSDRPKMHRHGSTAIPHHYIVVLDVDATPGAGDFSTTAATASLLSATYGAVPNHVYAHAINGFSAQMSEEQALALSDDPGVAFVEEDQVMSIDVTQTNATWGIDRIDQTNLPLSHTYSYTANGTGVNAYIIDTGIRRTHTQFGGRAFVGFDSVGDGRNTNDCNGHGTHVSGTVGGSTYGVAKNVHLFAVRVLNCSGSGTTSGVIAGVDWVTAHHVSPAVANMSLGGGKSPALDQAVTNLYNSGVFLAVAAGNDNVDACTESPSGAASVFTVAASTKTDAKASYSNWGSCVEAYAPGSAIVSTYLAGTTMSLSGTSMATPHVVGVAALYKATNGNQPSATVANWITTNATSGVITGNPSGTPNLLLFKSTL